MGNPKGGAIRVIRDWSAGCELQNVLGLDVSAPPAETWTDAELNLTDGLDQTMDGPLMNCIDEVLSSITNGVILVMTLCVVRCTAYIFGITLSVVLSAAMGAV